MFRHSILLLLFNAPLLPSLVLATANKSILCLFKGTFLLSTFLLYLQFCVLYASSSCSPHCHHSASVLFSLVSSVFTIFFNVYTLSLTTSGIWLSESYFCFSSLFPYYCTGLHLLFLSLIGLFPIFSRRHSDSFLSNSYHYLSNIRQSHCCLS